MQSHYVFCRKMSPSTSHPPAVLLAVMLHPCFILCLPPQLGMLPNPAGSSKWFPKLRDLRLLGHVSAADSDLSSLTHLTALSSLHLHLEKPSRGLAGRVTLRGLWNLAEQSDRLAEIRLFGAMETLLLVPGRMPGVGL